MLTDFNLDGLIDLVVVNRREPAQVWRNVTTDGGHWIEVALSQPAPNVDAIGAWLEVRLGQRILRREITVGGGHASGEIGWRHMGLGAVTAPEIRVIWPDGQADPWQTVGADAFYRLERGAPARKVDPAAAP